MAERHTLKTDPHAFEMVHRGWKTAEVRKDDRGFMVGDTLHLVEFCRSMQTYTGRELERTVSHILQGYGLRDGHVMLSFASPEHCGWIFHSPDTGTEWSNNHPIESGDMPDAQDIKPATAELLLNHLLDAWKMLAEAEAKAAKRAVAG